jgi:peptidoglycan/xylan/chitin deacetylase (PgdA/CDA1 family)
MRVVGEICAEAKGAPPARGSVLSWREIREAGAMSIGVAAHARTHPVLTMLPIEAARREIRESLADIERETGTAADAFCYPNGSASDAVVGAVSEAGVTVAFTTRNGHNDLRRADPLRLARQHISMRSSLPVFRARLSMFGGRVDTWRSRFVPGV